MDFLGPLFFMIASPVVAKDIPFNDKISRLSHDELVSEARKYNYTAIDERARRKDTAAIVDLRQIADEPDEIFESSKTAPGMGRENAHQTRQRGRVVFAKNRAHEIAKVALARMGQQQYFNEFIRGLSSPDESWKLKCIRYLGEIGDKRAIPSLITLMDEPPTTTTDVNENAPSNANPTRHRPVVNIPLSASMAISDIVPQANEQVLRIIDTKHLSFEAAWKEWWKENKREDSAPQ